MFFEQDNMSNMFKLDPDEMTDDVKEEVNVQNDDTTTIMKTKSQIEILHIMSDSLMKLTMTILMHLQYGKVQNLMLLSCSVVKLVNPLND